MKYTYAGDTNIDGKATFDDFQNFLIGFSGSRNPRAGIHRRFQPQRAVTFDDFQIFLGGYTAYNSGGVPLPDGSSFASPSDRPTPAHPTRLRNRRPHSVAMMTATFPLPAAAGDASARLLFCTAPPRMRRC